MRDLEPLAQLREVLREAEYCTARIREALDVEAGENVRPSDLPYCIRRLAGDSPFEILVRLFGLGVPVPTSLAETALPGGLVGALADLGVLSQKDGEVSALLALTDADGLFFLHDRPPADGNLRKDHVLGVVPSSRSLAAVTVPADGGRVWDLGTGCGVQAILAARTSAYVLATDTNPRAIEITQINAALNDISNIEVRLGSFFEPVAGEKFDLIVTNPPFVISPDTTYIYRDAGLAGDGASEQIIREAPNHLSEGGFTCVVCNWISPESGHWAAPVGTWLEGSGCDALVLKHSTRDALRYAYMWVKQTQGDDLESWLEYYERLGITHITMGAVIIRKRSGGGNWVRLQEMPEGEIRPAGEQIRSLFRSEDFLAALPNEQALAEARLKTVPAHKIRQQLSPTGDGDYAITQMTVELLEGLGNNATLDLAAMRILALCDGQRTLAQVAREVESVTEASPEETLSGVLQSAAAMLRGGFLVPSDDTHPETSERKEAVYGAST